MRRKATSDTRGHSEVAQRAPSRGPRPGSPGRRTSDHAKKRADRHPYADHEPPVQMIPSPCIDSHFAALAALPTAREDAATRRIEIALHEGERPADPRSGAPEQDDERPRTQPGRAIAGGTHDRHDLFHRWLIIGISEPLLRGGRPQCKPGMVAGDRRRPAASS
jgi:hypothetical protein